MLPMKLLMANLIIIKMIEYLIISVLCVAIVVLLLYINFLLNDCEQVEALNERLVEENCKLIDENFELRTK